MKDIGTFFIRIASIVFIPLATRNVANIKEAVVLSLYSTIAELDLRKIDSRKNLFIEERIIMACMGAMILFMVHVLLKGDRLLSALGFITFAILIGFAILVNYLFRLSIMQASRSPSSYIDAVSAILKSNPRQIIQDS